MAWHLRSIEFKCSSCGKRASYELFNTYNATSGYYCRRCGNIEVRKRNLDDIILAPRQSLEK